MACFIVPMTQAVATTVYRKLNAKKMNCFPKSKKNYNYPKIRSNNLENFIYIPKNIYFKIEILKY